ncbi:MAG TPA: glycoside hydrolase family 3 N-terminal domain-containing protein, partial [Bacteroidia bacterium]
KKQQPKEVIELIKKNKIGGLIFFQGGPVREAKLTNLYQSISKVPLLISIDGEWGLAMRLDSTIAFPRQMTLGAIQNDSLVYQMGKEIARQCKRMGIHVNLAPVTDVNNNPLNPVISNRSFGEEKWNVMRKAMMYMKGMQDNGVLANAKHFPGHGDTDSDSHKTLPTIGSSKQRLDTLELFPFRNLIDEGLGSMMVAHLFIPSLDTTTNQASTLSKNVVDSLLKQQLGFKGLIFTDALNMKGVSKFYKPGELDVKALIAGNDVLLFSENVPKAIEEIKKAIADSLLTQDIIDARCKKILMAKQWCGLDHYKPIRIKGLIHDLNTPEGELVNRKLVENAVTLLQNKNDLIPLMRLDTLRTAVVSLGYKDDNPFKQMLRNYSPMDTFGLDNDAKQPLCDSLLKSLDPYNLVIVQLNNTNNHVGTRFGLTPQVINTLNAIIAKKRTIVDLFSNPYILGKLDSLRYADAVIMSYEAYRDNEELSAQLIFGGISSRGKLPITASSTYKLGTGIFTGEPIRFKYTIPEELGIDSRELQKIDSIALHGIAEKVYPGCQVFVAMDGKVIYQRSFGYHTYEDKVPVTNTDIYDLASVTKIAASTASIMKLVEQKKLFLDDSLGKYLPYLNGSNKQGLVFRQILTHQSGLKEWIPFWMHTMDKGKYKPGIYDTVQSANFPYRVAAHLYISKTYRDTIYNMIVQSEVKDAGRFKYSDLGYYFMKQIIEDSTHMPLEKYTYETFYKPLGLATMGFRPRERFSLGRIIPTEYDIKFRKQLVWGDVHDQGAAMLGGVGGHAGLFSDANDLGVLMQMYMNYGMYGGVRYIDSNVVKEFIKCQFCKDNRRGIGFDKPETNPQKESPVCDCVSYLSFGHTGFTGTIAWADPEKKLVYVFLSNRVYPDADVNKLAKSGIRTKIQQVIYDAVAHARTIQ